MITQKPLDLDEFYRSRQEIAGELNTIYAQKQVAGIRQVVQEAKIARATKPVPAKEEKKGDK